MAADDRSPGRQGHRRVRHHDARRLSGHRQRHAGRAGGSGKRPAPHALAAGRADLLMALRGRRVALCRETRGRRARRAPGVLGVPAGRRPGLRALREGRAPVVRVLLGLHRAVCLSEAGARGGSRHGRRHRTCQQHLLRREGHHRRAWSRGPRNGAPVVWRCHHRARLERHLAERGVRHVFHFALCRACRGARRVRRRRAPQPRDRADAREDTAEHAGRAPEPG